MSIFTTIDNIPAIIEQLHKACSDIVAETATEIAKTYEATAPKLTGFMASSAYTVTHDTSTYGARLVGDGPLLPQVEKPENDLTAIAAVAAEYAAYPEFGTVNMRAQPAFYPAVDKAEKFLSKELSELEKRMKV